MDRDSFSQTLIVLLIQKEFCKVSRKQNTRPRIAYGVAGTEQNRCWKMQVVMRDKHIRMSIYYD